MSLLKKLEKGVSNRIPHTHTSEKRTQMQAAREQIDYYQQQKQFLIEEQDRISAQQERERQRLHQKQIRALRRNFRPAGFLDYTTPGTESSLG